MQSTLAMRLTTCSFIRVFDLMGGPFRLFNPSFPFDARIAVKCIVSVCCVGVGRPIQHFKDGCDMERETKPGSIFGAVVFGLILFCIAMAFCLIAYVSLTANVSGTASLPNGITAKINGPFSCSESAAGTEIEAGGHIFAFSPKAISIDGVPVRPLDATVTDVRIDAGYWSATLCINGADVSKLR